MPLFSFIQWSCYSYCRPLCRIAPYSYCSILNLDNFCSTLRLPFLSFLSALLTSPTLLLTSSSHRVIIESKKTTTTSLALFRPSLFFIFSFTHLLIYSSTPHFSLSLPKIYTRYHHHHQYITEPFASLFLSTWRVHPFD